MKNALLLFIFATVSCSSPEKFSVKSEWTDLKSAAKSRCSPWPMAEQDLEVQALIPVEGSKGVAGIIGSVKRRNASLAHIFMPVNPNLELDADRATQIPTGQNAVLVGGWVVNNKPMVVMAINNGNRATLEARTVKDNRVFARSQFVMEGNVREADVVADGDDIWMSLRTGDYSTVYAKLKIKGTSGQFEKVGQPTESRGSTLVVDRESHQAYLVESQPNSERITLRVSQVKGKEFAFGAARQLQMDAKEGVESWAAVSGLGGFFFAAVTGDSMVGQSQMVVAAVGTQNDSLSWTWQKVVPMPDIHVSEPVWALSKIGGEVTIMKWLEGEATLGVYSASKTALTTRKDRGIYPKGSIVTSAFSPSSEALATIVRQRRDDLWNYSVCSSDL